MTKDQIKQASKILNVIDQLENQMAQIQSGMAIRSTLRLSPEVVEAGEEAMISKIETNIESLNAEFGKL